MLKDYIYYSMLLFVIGKQKCKNIRREDFLEDNNTVITECDYAEALKT